MRGVGVQEESHRPLRGVVLREAVLALRPPEVLAAAFRGCAGAVAFGRLLPAAGAGVVAGAAASPAARLNVIQAGVGTAIYMVPVQEVLYFEAADK